MKNIPYKRGSRKEPITKENPYLNPFPNRRQRRKALRENK